jgi:hypothetical protein
LTKPFKTAEFEVIEVAELVVTVGADVVGHTLQPLATQVADSAVPSPHFVTPPTQTTPPWLEQQPVQSALAVPPNMQIRAKTSPRIHSLLIILLPITHF